MNAIRTRDELTVQEREWLFVNGLTIIPHWLSPTEGTEYALFPTGGTGDPQNIIAVRKSWRAAYNAACHYVRQRR
jgi:hypothetical protein